MNYVTQLNAFCEKAVGVLDAKEQAMYLRLFYIANRLKWPEWFSVANSQLMRELKAGKNVVISLKRSLQKKGFIEVLDPGHKKATMYHLVPLVEIPKGSKNKPIDTKGSEIEHHGFQNRTSRVSKRDTSININNKHISTTTSNRETQKKENPDFLEVVNSYQQEIRPMCSPMELEKLADDIEHFGKDAVLKAIERSFLRNKRSLGYIEAILRRWETDGYDEVGKEDANGNNVNSGPAGKSYRRGTPLNSLGHKENYDPEAEARKWANESANDWEPEPWH